MRSTLAIYCSDVGAWIRDRAFSVSPSAPLFILLMLLPAAFLLGPLPIDETRYLGVAWEMHRTSDFLVPHVNGQWYSDKPPLLFWLINLAWALTGVCTWSARLVTFVCAALNLVLLGRICRQLGLDERAAHHAQWLLAGSFYVALFATAIMFDVLLSTCVLAALSGFLQILAGQRRAGATVMALAVGAGILAKGPVMLLDIVFAIACAPWWNGAFRTPLRVGFSAIVFSMLTGIAIALGWAIPAAIVGGGDYAQSLFFHQTIDRMASSFAHERPVWWYLLIVPMMALPWSLSLRTRRGALSFFLGDRACRFALAWVVPTFVVFCAIGSKQPHYLLPLLPAVAIVVASSYSHGACAPRRGVFPVLLFTIGIFFAGIGWLAAQVSWLAPFAGVSPLWGTGVTALAIVFTLVRHRTSFITAAAIASIMTVGLVECAVAGPISRHDDVTPVAMIIHDAQRKGQPVVHLGRHYGLYEYAGRLTEPLPVITAAELPRWCAIHRDGLVVAMDGDLQLDAPAIYSKPFRDARVSVWKAGDAIGARVVDIRPNRAHD